jgi:VWFA-related protein
MRGALALLLGVAALFPPAAGGYQPGPSAQPAQSAVPSPQSEIPNPQSEIPNPQSGVSRLVTIAVIVTDARGRAVDDLKPSDFELRRESAALPLESARFVRAGRAAADAPVLIQNAVDERQAALPDDTRLFAIFLDEYHVSGGANSERVRAALTRFVDDDLSPRDLVVVMKPLDSLFAIRLTRDRAAVRAMIDSFEGRKGDYAPRNAYERDYIAGTPARIDAARNQVALSAINALAVHLGSLSDRRKTLVVASEGVGRADRRRGQEFLPTLDTVIRSANRSNVAVYPFDPRDDSADRTPAEGLRRMADETDGQAIADDASSGLQSAAADSGAYYLLSFRANHPDDARFRELQTRVKRAGARVRAPKGYWAAPPDEALRAAVLARSNEPKRTAPPEPPLHVSTLIRPWFGMSRGDGGKTRVTFVWEPAVRVPGDRVRRFVSRLVLTARSSDGTVLFEGPVAPTGPAAMNDPAMTPSRAVFDMPPGRLRLRMSIQDVAQEVLDQDVRDISIRDLRGEVAIGTPEVLRARNAREFRTLDAEAAVPVSSREFSRTERLLIRFPAYGAGGAPPDVSAKLLGRMGNQIRDLPVAPAATPGDTAIDLPLAGFAAGEYVIEVTAKSGARDASDRVGFRVTN